MRLPLQWGVGGMLITHQPSTPPVRWIILTGPNAREKPLSTLKARVIKTGSGYFYIAEFPPQWNTYQGLKDILEQSWLEGCFLCSIRLAKPVNEVVPLSQVADTIRGMLTRMQKPKRVMVRVRGHGSGKGFELYKALRSLVNSLGIRSTSHSGRVLIVEVNVWPNWRSPSGEPMATVSVYPRGGVIENWVRRLEKARRKARLRAMARKPELKPEYKGREPTPVRRRQVEQQAKQPQSQVTNNA